MDVPQLFKPKKDLKKKVQDLTKGITIPHYKDLELEEQLQKKKYQFVAYQNLTFSELKDLNYPEGSYWTLFCEFRYKGKMFYAKHWHEPPIEDRISLEASEGELKHRFDEVFKKLLRYNKNKGNNPLWDGKVEWTGFHTADFTIQSNKFKTDFETAFYDFYSQKFQDAKIDYVTLRKITGKALQSSRHLKHKITKKVEEQHPPLGLA